MMKGETEMNERIEKKLAQIEKIEKRVAKWEKKCSEEEIKLANQFKHDYPGWVRYHKENNLSYGDSDELRLALRDLDTAKEQLAKIQRQLEVKKAKEDTLNDMPEALKKFAEKMEMIWNEYDKNEREFLRRRYKEYEDAYPEDRFRGYKEFIKEYKHSGYEKMHVTDEEIEKENKKAVDSLILNLFNRVIEKTGKITDAAGLRVTSGNDGYAVINGVVIGEKGRAVVESIGAGGYNIQRYHIRTLVK